MKHVEGVRDNSVNLREHASGVGNSLPLASGVVLKIRHRGPVGRLVGSDSTRGTVGLDKSVIIDRLTESWNTSSSVFLLFCKVA